MTTWYVAYTEPRMEQRVHDAVAGDRFGSYLPLEQTSRVYRGKREEITRPLFPRYVFVSFDKLADEWGDLYMIDGLLKICGDTMGNPTMVPIWQIDLLRRAEAAGAFALKSAFTVGDAVRIAVGPFSGFLAKLKSCSPGRRVKVLMNFLGQQSTLDLSNAEIERV